MNKPKILVVDYQEEERTQLVQFLVPLFLGKISEVLEAKSSEEALEMVTGNKPDLIIMTVYNTFQSEKEDLINAIKEIRKQNKHNIILTIVGDSMEISSNILNNIKQECIEGGSDICISDPFSLGSAISELLKIPYSDYTGETMSIIEDLIKKLREKFK